VTDKFPHLVKEIALCSFPPGTLVVGEILIEQDGIDFRDTFGSIASSGIENALRLQKELGLARFVLFDLVVFGGTLLVDEPYTTRLTALQAALVYHPLEFLSVIEVLDLSFAEAKNRSIKSGWEGLVLYDADAASEIRMDGNFNNTPRPAGSWKWKPIQEDDFVITGWTKSKKGRNKGFVKDFLIAQYHPITGELVDCGKVGTGLTLAARQKYADDALYPMVFEIRFERRTSKNKLDQGCILRQRSDKEPKECILPLNKLQE